MRVQKLCVYMWLGLLHVWFGSGKILHQIQWEVVTYFDQETNVTKDRVFMGEMRVQPDP